MSNVPGAASTTQQLQLEALNEVIKLLIEKEANSTLASPSAAPSLQSLCAASVCASRLHSQATSPCLDLDGGILPAGNFSAWDQGTLTLLAIVHAAGILPPGGHYWREVNRRKSSRKTPSPKPSPTLPYKWQRTATSSCSKQVTERLVRSTPPMQRAQQTLSSSPQPPWGFWASLVAQGQQVQVMSNAYVLRGSCYITNVNNKLGSQQSITVDTVPSGHSRRRLHHGRRRRCNHPGVLVRHPVLP